MLVGIRDLVAYLYGTIPAKGRAPRGRLRPRENRNYLNIYSSPLKLLKIEVGELDTR